MYDYGMSKNLFTLAALAIVCAQMLSACGGGSTSSTSTTTSPTPISAGPKISADRLLLPQLGDSLNEKDCGYQYTLTSNIPLTGTDPLLSSQWYINNTGNNTGPITGIPGQDLQVFGAWASNKGEGIRVAIVDDAIEITHPDLAPNAIVAASLNYRSQSPYANYPLPCFDGTYAGNFISEKDDHGTAVAGIIASRDSNGIGISGVAPRVGLAAFNALTSGTDADISDALNRDLLNNSILHNSWGSQDDGLLHTADSLFVAAINNGISNGRAGKGSIFVFPAGNGGCYSTNNDGSCRYEENSNFDGYVNKLGQITVCSVGPTGVSPVYAEPGANILVCAPASRITTLAVQGQYRSDFSGTSASAPMVSGVIALMLSANPNLTWRDVKRILALTARRNDTTNAGWTTYNGLNFNQYYGFGVADATKAVAMAKTFTSVGNSSTMKTCGPYNRTPNRTLPDMVGTTVSEQTDSVTVGADCTISEIEFIEVTFTADHQYSGDLSINLQSPNNLVSNLANKRGCASSGSTLSGDDCRPYNNWQFGSVRHLLEPALGTWTLKVTDRAPSDTGVWKNWGIKFYGR